MKRLYTPIFIILLTIGAALQAAAQAPKGYYRTLEGKKEAELKTAVYQLVHNFTQVSSYNDLPRYFERTDVYPQSKRWWDMYSDIPLYAPSFKGLNREHSFPKSWWGGLTDIPAYVDLNHLYPSEADANMAKSNYPLGLVDRTQATKFDNGMTCVGYPQRGLGGGCQWVFEPDDEYKGDFARTYFYMATCYQDLTWRYTYMVSNGTYPTLTGWAQEMLLKWHRNDPVSQKEIDRNNTVYSIQNNRNPFIDEPELAEYIWGNKRGQGFTAGGSGTPTEPAADPVLITPTQGMELEFGQVALGSTAHADLFFRGENLTGALDLALSGANRAMFSTPVSSLRADLVNAAGGTWLRISYNPTELGTHEARIIISEGGMLGGSRGVKLRGECLPVPTLGACTATSATDVTDNSYVANWTYPEGDIVDYWVVTRDRYIGNEVQSEEIEAEGPGLLIEDFGGSDSEAYSVQSVRLGYRSPASNVIFVNHSGITDASADQGLVVQGFEGCLRFVCSAPHTGVRVLDTTGRAVLILDSVSNNTDIDMLPGVYMVVTDRCRTPRKVIVK